MGKEIDEKVVSMKFDNQQFENNVKTSMSTIDKLKSKLQFRGATKGLENVDDAAKKVNMNPLASAAEQVGIKFNALQIMATTALANITNSAVNAGKRIVSALTIDPIKMGLNEYETQINSVQTILANTESKGTTLTDVNNALDELNKYADKTIYNFTEMTRNIGTFTAAGVDLDTSVNAIQGIANLAAVSGSNSQQASTAMYQLSQALASGTVKLMDWNSVVNAGMGGQVFQDALKETARVHGIAIDDMIEENGSFRDTLQEEWLTAEILTETLQKFTMATEGLTEEQIEQNRAMLKSKGYTDEQIEGIFKLGDTATNAATKVKTFTQLMDTLKESAQSGWTQTWEILIGDFEEAKELWTSVSDVFGKIINDSAEARNSMLQGWADGGGREAMLESFKNVFEGLVSVVKPIREAFREIFPRTTSEQLIKITEAIRDFTEKLTLSETASKHLKSTFKGLFAFVDIVWTAIKEIVSGIARLIGKIFELFSGIGAVTGSLGDWISGVRDSVKETNIFGYVIDKTVDILTTVIDKIKEFFGLIKEKVIAPGFEGFLNVLSKIWEVIKLVGTKIAEIFVQISGALTNALRAGDIKAAVDVFNTGVIGAILLSIRKFVSGFASITSSFKDFGKLTEGVKGILDSVKGCFEAWQQSIKAEALKKIATAIAILAVSILILASIDPSRLTIALGGIAGLFAELIASLQLLMILGNPIKHVFKTMTMMFAMSISILILASALKKIADLDLKSLAIGLAGVLGLMVILVTAVNSLKASINLFSTSAAKIIALAIALNLLTIAVKSLGGMNLVDLAKGLGGVLVALFAMVGAAKLMSKFWAHGAFQLIAMATALNMLIIPIVILSKLNLKGIIQGVGALAAMLLVLVVAANAMQATLVGAAAMLLLSAAFIGLAVGLTVLTPALAAISLIDMNAVCVGLLKLAGTLLLVGAASIVAPLLILMGLGLKALGSGLLALAPGLLALVALDFAGIFSSLLKLAGVLVVLAISAVVSPLILLLGAALVVLGLGAKLAGPGLLLLAAGLTAFATALAASLNIIIQGITAIVTSIIGFIPAIIEAIGNGIILICNIIAGSVGALAGAISAVIIAVCDAIITATPKLIEMIGKLLDALLKFIVEYFPKLVDAGIKLILSLLDGIAQNIEKVVEKGVQVVVNFIKGIASQIPVLVEAAFDLILDFIYGIGDAIEKYTPLLMEACVDLGVSIVNGVVKGLMSIPGAIWEGIKSVGQSIIDGFCNFFGINSPAKAMIPIGQGLDEGLIVGLENYKGSVVDATEDVGKAAVNSMSNVISDISNAINSDVDAQPVIRPVLDLSNIESGAGAINGMFGMTPSVDVLSNVGSINSMMSRNQNGESSDIMSAINALGDKIAAMAGGNTYVIEGITYDDGTNIATAVSDLIRAARIERRV